MKYLYQIIGAIIFSWTYFLKCPLCCFKCKENLITHLLFTIFILIYEYSQELILPVINKIAYIESCIYIIFTFLYICIILQRLLKVQLEKNVYSIGLYKHYGNQIKERALLLQLRPFLWDHQYLIEAQIICPICKSMTQSSHTVLQIPQVMDSSS